ncbi:hypothetical protein F2Q69_00005063 [Brassica cretica]|uniref:Uncharacterized protein n=1 Tax=Brassica cretica TaxID=69181 RepID=A0A8S9PH49_BRACR|nr:hypothetical protein F2Q69_00005063 [Brassica cretica]
MSTRSTETAFEIADVVEEERNREEKGKKERKNLDSTVPLSNSEVPRRPKRPKYRSPVIPLIFQVYRLHQLNRAGSISDSNVVNG